MIVDLWYILKSKIPCRHSNLEMEQATLWTVDPMERPHINVNPIPIRLRRLKCMSCGRVFDQKIEIPEDLWEKGIEL